MTHQEALQLIPPGSIVAKPQYWLELGCGTGTFTYALAHRLPANSSILAIDRSVQQLHSTADVSITFQQADMRQFTPTKPVNGVLLANSLHYVEEQELFLKKMMQWFQQDIQILLIEYDTEQSSHWLPWPVSKQKVASFANRMSLSITFLGQRASVYQRSQIYSAQLVSNNKIKNHD